MSGSSLVPRAASAGRWCAPRCRPATWSPPPPASPSNSPIWPPSTATACTRSRSTSPTRPPSNFWGVYHVSKAAIPVLREQGGGVIMQFSSVGGRVGGSPGIASYQAAKFAIDGFSRVLAAETAPFGVRVVVVEPSGFKTDWAGSSMIIRDIPAEYAGTVGAINERVRHNPAGPAGDPDRAAEILVRLAKRRDIPYHLPLGVTAAEASIRLDEQLLAEDTKWRAVSRSADFAEPYPVAFPPDSA